jgi:hypothetical protein
MQTECPSPDRGWRAFSVCAASVRLSGRKSEADGPVKGRACGGERERRAGLPHFPLLEFIHDPFSIPVASAGRAVSF